MLISEYQPSALGGEKSISVKRCPVSLAIDMLVQLSHRLKNSLPLLVHLCIGALEGLITARSYLPTELWTGAIRLRIESGEKESSDHSAASSNGGRLWPSRRSTSSAASARLVPGPKIA